MKTDDDAGVTTYFYYDPFGRVIAEYEKPDGGSAALARVFVYGNGIDEVLAMFTPYHAGDPAAFRHIFPEGLWATTDWVVGLCPNEQCISKVMDKAGCDCQIGPAGGAATGDARRSTWSGPDHWAVFPRHNENRTERPTRTASPRP